MNQRTRRLTIVGILLLTLVLGVISLYISSRVGQEQSATDSDAAAAGSKACGQTCDSVSDCAGSTVPSVSVDCINNRCVNTECPDDTLFGSRCDCTLSNRVCGEPCGSVQCSSGYACTYRAQQAPYCDAFATQTNLAVCVPIGRTESGNRGQITRGGIWGTSQDDFSTWEYFERRQCAPRPDSNNNYLYHPQISTSQPYTDDEFIREYVCGEKVVYLCDEGSNTCEGVQLSEIGDRRDFYLEVDQCLASGCGGDCGDGEVNFTEQCDDGNTEDGDGCSSQCEVTTQCSDGVDNDDDGRIDCEPGNEDPGCFPDGNGGGGDCDEEDNTEEDNIECGNGVLEGTEQCDDGNTVSGDGCSASCQSTTQCSDGIDNDGDGSTDCSDPGCFTDGRGGGECIPSKDSEVDTAAPNPQTPNQTTQCSDGVDNDGDGRIDCTIGNEDPGCFPNGMGGGGACNPNDNAEFDIPATAIFGDSRDYIVYGFIFIVIGLLLLRSTRSKNENYA